MTTTTTDEVPVTDNEPLYSSAAQCIRLVHMGQTFAPEYTHQCFDGEWIRGYQPLLKLNGQHSTHALPASHSLLIRILLGPSCRTCTVELEIQPRRSSVPQRGSKRQRLLQGNSDCVTLQQTSMSSTEEDSDDTQDDYNEDYEKEENNGAKNQELHSDAGSTRHRRMHPDEIQERLKKALPEIINADSKLVEEDYLSRPLGRVVQTVESYVLSLATAEQANEYHQQVQNLALWYIESADGVNLIDTKNGGYWKVLYVWKKHGTRQYSLAGYMTLFHFQSPFRKPTPGTIVRICQVLVLPPYQRQGLGQAMMRAVYQYAENDDLVEVNVEDPAPACTALRNAVDYRRLLDSLDSPQPWMSAKYLQPHEFPSLEPHDRMRAAMLGRITPQQVEIAYELLKLSNLPRDDELLEKQYRLMVKRRLLHLHAEELSLCKSKEERQVRLAEIWRIVYHDYKTLLKRM
jgi:histone acetyltransferase 1